MTTRVLHILGSLSIGGAENLVLDLINYGLSKGAVYHLIYMHNSPPERVKLFEQTGIPIQRIAGGKGIGKTLQFIQKLRGYLKTQKIDTIHCHNNIDAYWAILASAGLKTSEGKRIQLILSVHGFNLNFNYLSGKFPFSLLPLPDQNLLQKSKIVFVSLQTQAFYVQKYPHWKLLSQASVVYNGIHYSKIASASAVQLLPAGKPVFGMVGSFNAPINLPEKRGQYLVCKAIKLLSEKYNGELPFRFVFVGAPNSTWSEANPEYLPAGDQYALCRDFCTKNNLVEQIRFIPPRSDIYNVLSGLACYVYSSRVDTFGLSVIEAVLCKLPVICSDVPTFQEITLGGKLAQLVPDSSEAFATAIQQFIDRGDLPKEVYAVNERIHLAQAHYSIEQCSEQLNRLYV